MSEPDESVVSNTLLGSLREEYGRLFSEPWPPWVGGLLLGLMNVMLFTYAQPWTTLDGVINWGDWLETGRQKGRWQPFEEAREFVRGLGLKNTKEWFAYSKGELPEKGKRPDDIPSNPHKAYKDQWISWGDWLA